METASGCGRSDPCQRFGSGKKYLLDCRCGGHTAAYNRRWQTLATYRHADCGRPGRSPCQRRKTCQHLGRSAPGNLSNLQRRKNLGKEDGRLSCIFGARKTPVAVLTPDSSLSQRSKNGAHNEIRSETPDLEPGYCWSLAGRNCRALCGTAWQAGRELSGKRNAAREWWRN